MVPMIFPMCRVCLMSWCALMMFSMETIATDSFRYRFELGKYSPICRLLAALVSSHHAFGEVPNLNLL